MNGMNSTASAGRGQWWLAIGLVALACLGTVILRLYPIAYNFTPVGALCLCLKARTRTSGKSTIPLLLMRGTDYPVWPAMPERTLWHSETPSAYGSFLVMFLLGRFLVRGSDNPVRILGAAVAGGVPFFLVTNFGAWYNVAIAHTVVPVPGLDDYSADVFGLLHCYWMGLPFHRAMLSADIVFSAVLFGAYALASRRAAATERPQEAAS